MFLGSIQMGTDVLCKGMIIISERTEMWDAGIQDFLMVIVSAKK